MRETEFRFDEGLKGLRKYQTNRVNEESLLICRNLMPMEQGYKGHEVFNDMNGTGITWNGLGKLTAATATKSITLNVKDYLTDSNLQTVAVWLDGVSKGNTDASGNITITGVSVGGHTIKLTKTSYVSSDDDDLANSYIVVT